MYVFVFRILANIYVIPLIARSCPRYIGIWHIEIYIHISIYMYFVVQLLCFVQLFVTPWTATCQASLSFTISWNLPKLILYCPLLLLPSIFPSIRVFSKESVICIRYPKFWSFSFGISLSNEYSGLISFRMDWFDLLAVQGLSNNSNKVNNYSFSIL